MSPVRGPSLIARLTLVQVLVLALLWLVVITLTISGMYQRRAGDIDVELRALARSFASLGSATGDPREAARIGAELAALQLENSDPPLGSDELAYQIWSADGRELAHSGEQPALIALPPQISLDHAESAPAGWYARGVWSRSRQMYAVAAKRVSYYQRRVRSTVGELVALWLVLAALSGAAFWWSFRRVIRPVRELADRVGGRSTHDLSPVDETDSFRRSVRCSRPSMRSSRESAPFWRQRSASSQTQRMSCAHPCR